MFIKSGEGSVIQENPLSHDTDGTKKNVYFQRDMVESSTPRRAAQ